MEAGLAAVFVEGRAPPHPPLDQLEAVLGALAQAGREAWPALAYDERAFARDLSRRLGEGDAVASLSALRGPDLFLACACARGEARALAAFDERHLGALRRTLSAEQDVDDLLQELREKLLLAGSPGISEYSGRGSLAGWLRVVAVHALQKRRRRGAAEEQRAQAAIEDVVADPQLDFLKRRDRPRFQQAFKAALCALPVRERNLLRLHYAEGLTAERLGVLHRVHRVTVTRWLSGARQLLLDELRRELAQSLRLNRSEVSSLVRLLGSRLEISLLQSLGG